ncbi:MAG: immunoglobulin domain-containing protein [Geothrix sp.]|nr:immunoglobulin domain-containing protein [Geothrix sp.]
MKSLRSAMKVVIALSAFLLLDLGCGGGSDAPPPPPPPVAPAISVQPANQTVLDGSTATFTVTASGTAPLAYQWKKGGTAITTGGTSASYTTPATVLADSGSSFTVTVTNVAGAVTSTAATLTVNPAPPTITTQPTSQTVTAPAAATFTVVAAGSAPLTYQWKQGATAITGATSASYTRSATTLADNGASFTVTVTNAQGTVTSSAAVLTVQAAPVFITQPAGGTVTAGTAVTFTAAATGNPAPAYQWYKGTTLLTGQTAATLTIPSATLADAGSYTVTATNTVGSVTSSAAVLVVNQAPIFTTQPASQTIVSGQPVTFSVTATGFPVPTYQWNKNGTAVSGQTNSSYTIAAVAPADAGSYTVDVTNTLGTVTSNAAVLTVTVPPTITTQPTSQTVLAPAAATFSVVATGTPTPTYQWKKNGTNITGATAASYTTLATSLADQGASFTVVVTNSAGTVTSSAALLTVNEAPAITTQPLSQTIVSGSPVTFSVTATGFPVPTYQWNKNGTAVSGQTGSSYTIAAVAPADAGSYTVDVTNAIATATSAAAVLTVTVPPAITTQPATQTVTAPATATFTVVATGTPAPTYQWQKNLTPIAGATSASYTTLATSLADNQASYTVVVTNGVGSPVTSNAAILTVQVAPAITSHPSNQSVIVGQTATFSVTATGNPAPTYQWRKGGLDIGGATLATYTTPVTVIGDDGSSFDVVVSNGIGSPATSLAAILSVAPAPVTPVFLTQPVSQTIVSGSSVTFTSSTSGTPTPTYQWKKDGTNIPGATSSSFTIVAVTPADAANYTVVATNTEGSATSNVATLTVNYAPVITVQPASQTVSQGTNVTFSVAANAVPPVTGYQWRFYGSNIVGATGSSYTQNNVNTGNTGNYDVVVTNSIGSTTSSVAILTVILNHSVSGQVTLVNTMTGVQGVTVSLNTTPTATTAVTDGTGYFTLTNIPDGSYTLTPSLVSASAIFIPATQAVTVAGVDRTGINFQAVVGYSVSGTVSYPGSKTGRIYLKLDGGNGSAPGVSVSATGAFTIRGVAPGTYTLNAWMDTVGLSVPNAANPLGTTVGISVSSANVAGIVITLADAAPVTLTGAAGPTINGVVPMAGGAFFSWSPLQTAQYIETADSYLIQWSTSSTFATITGSASVPAMGDGNPMYFSTGLTNGTAYYFRMYGKAGLTTSNASATSGPITPAVASGGSTISGTVTFPTTATGPMYVGLYDMATGIPYVMRIASPVSPQAFSVAGVPNGTMFFFGIIDQNNNGVVDPGDISNINSNISSSITVSGSLAGQNLTLSGAGAIATVSTYHQSYSGANWTGESYGLQFSVDQNAKLPVNVTLSVGTAVLDVGKSTDGTGYWYWVNLSTLRPTVGGTYPIHVGYSDGTSEDLITTVSAVLDTFPTNLAPVTGTSTSTTPLFTWAAPTVAPTFPYTYGLWISPQSGGTIWQYPSDGDMPSTQLSVAYNVDGRASQGTLTPGVTYNWSISLMDGNGNSAQRVVEYKP